MASTSSSVIGHLEAFDYLRSTCATRDLDRNMAKILVLGYRVVIIHETESYLWRIKLFKQGLKHE